MHTDCLFAWLKVNKTCPLCKRDLKLELEDEEDTSFGEEELKNDFISEEEETKS